MQGKRPEPDINAMVLAMKEGAAVGSAVAAARPGWPDLGRVVAALHAEMVASVWGGTDDRLAQRPLRPLSAAAGHTPGTPALNPDNQLVLQVANTSVTAVRDTCSASPTCARVTARAAP